MDIDKLRDELRRHDYLYYTLAKPEISDYDYDMMFKRLQAAEVGEVVPLDSPTQVVGGFSAEIHMKKNGL
jgi:DNA ligase (NAD+)